MTKQDLRKQLNEKKTEYIRMQAEYDRLKYKKQIALFTDAIASSNELLDVIRINNLGAEEIRFLSEKTIHLIPQIYTRFSHDISMIQTNRANKNKARTARRHSRKIEQTSTQFTEKS